MVEDQRTVRLPHSGLFILSSIFYLLYSFLIHET